MALSPIRSASGGLFTVGGSLRTTAPTGEASVSFSQTIYVESLSVGTQTDLPFRHLVKIKGGELPSGSRLVVKEGESSIAIREDNRTTDVDSDIRLVQISGIIPSITAGERKTLTITAEAGSPASSTGITASDILATDYEVEAKMVIGGTDFSALATDGLGASTSWDVDGPTYHGTWLDNDFCTCHIVSVPLEESGPAFHGWLRTWFHIYAYKAAAGAVSGGNPITSIRTDVIQENGYFDVASPDDVTYDYDIDVTDSGTTTVVTRSAFDHFYFCRYRDMVWWGDELEYFTGDNWDDFKHSEVIPNYDWDYTDLSTISTTVLDDDSEPFSSVNAASSSRDLAWNYSNSGDSAWIGIIGNRQVRGLCAAEGLHADAYAGYRWVVEQGEVASWVDIHARDEATGKIIDISTAGTTESAWRQFGSASFGGDRIEQATTVNGSGWNWDQAHNHNTGFAAYLATGDLIFIEEQQFNSHWMYGVGNVGNDHWVNREDGYDRIIFNGFDNARQQRAVAWQMRTIGQTAFCTPDAVDGSVLGWTKTLTQTWIENQFDFFVTDWGPGSISADGDNEAGKRFVQGGATFMGYGGGSLYSASGAGHGYSAQWMANYGNLTLQHLGELGGLNVDGLAFRDWHITGVLSACNLSSGTWGTAKDALAFNWIHMHWDGTRSADGEGYASCNWNDVYFANISYVQGSIAGPSTTFSREYVGCTLDGQTGATIQVTFDSPVFTGTLTDYVDCYLQESMSAPGYPNFNSGTVNASDEFDGWIRVDDTPTYAGRVVEIEITGTWSGTITLQSSPTTSFSSPTDEATYTTNQSTTHTDTGSGNVYYRIGFKAGEYTSGAAVVTLTFIYGGKGKITSVSSSTVCEVDATYTHDTTNTPFVWDGAPFSGTSLTVGNIHYPGVARDAGTVATRTLGDDTYCSLSLAAVIGAQTDGQAGADTARTYMDLLMTSMGAVPSSKIDFAKRT